MLAPAYDRLDPRDLADDLEGHRPPVSLRRNDPLPLIHMLDSRALTQASMPHNAPYQPRAAKWARDSMRKLWLAHLAEKPIDSLPQILQNQHSAMDITDIVVSQDQRPNRMHDTVPQPGQLACRFCELRPRGIPKPFGGGVVASDDVDELRQGQGGNGPDIHTLLL